MSYKLEKRNIKVFSATLRTDKSIIEYEFSKKGKGWYITKNHFAIESGFPKVTNMYIPDELVEQILMVETVKNELTESE